MLTSFTRDEKKILLFLFGLIGISSVIVGVAEKGREVPVLRGTPLNQVGTASDAATTPTVQTGEAPSTLGAALGPDGKLDLNAASAEALRSIPGVGTTMADNIVAYRAQNGAFRMVDDLDHVPGIGPATLAKLRPHLYVAEVAPLPPATQSADHSPQQPTSAGDKLVPALPLTHAAPPGTLSRAYLASPANHGGAVAGLRQAPAAASGGLINLNTATAAELETLHRVGPVLAQRIIQHRNSHGPFRSVNDLDAVKGVGPKILQDNRARLTVH